MKNENSKWNLWVLCGRGSPITFKWIIKMISEDAPRTSGMSTGQPQDEHLLTLGTSSNHRRLTKLKYHRGKKVDLARVTRRVKGEGCGSYPLCIKCKTTTSLAELMRKWPWTVVAQLKLQGKSLLICSGWDWSPGKAISTLKV